MPGHAPFTSDDSTQIEPGTLGWGGPARGAEMGGEDAPEGWDERELSLGLRLLFDPFILKLIV